MIPILLHCRRITRYGPDDSRPLHSRLQGLHPQPEDSGFRRCELPAGGPIFRQCRPVFQVWSFFIRSRLVLWVLINWEENVWTNTLLTSLHAACFGIFVFLLMHWNRRLLLIPSSLIHNRGTQQGNDTLSVSKSGRKSGQNRSQSADNQAIQVAGSPSSFRTSSAAARNPLPWWRIVLMTALLVLSTSCSY